MRDHRVKLRTWITLFVLIAVMLIFGMFTNWVVVNYDPHYQKPASTTK